MVYMIYLIYLICPTCGQFQLIPSVQNMLFVSCLVEAHRNKYSRQPVKSQLVAAVVGNLYCETDSETFCTDIFLSIDNCR